MLLRSCVTMLVASVLSVPGAFESPRHILMLNIPYGRSKNKDGARDFQKMTFLRLNRYAHQVGAGMQVIHRVAEVPTTRRVVDAWTRIAPGRGNSTIYVLKLLAIGQALEKHERVLLVDDTVFVTPNASDIFAACPSDVAVCAFSEGTSPVQEMAMTYSRAKLALKAKGISAMASRYFNTGVVVFGQAARAILTSDQIADGMTYFATGHPSQDYLCAQVRTVPLPLPAPSLMLCRNSRPCLKLSPAARHPWQLMMQPTLKSHMLHRAFNFMPGRNLLVKSPIPLREGKGMGLPGWGRSGLD